MTTPWGPNAPPPSVQIWSWPTVAVLGVVVMFFGGAATRFTHWAAAEWVPLSAAALSSVAWAAWAWQTLRTENRNAWPWLAVLGVIVLGGVATQSVHSAAAERVSLLACAVSALGWLAFVWQLQSYHKWSIWLKFAVYGVGVMVLSGVATRLTRSTDVARLILVSAAVSAVGLVGCLGQVTGKLSNVVAPGDKGKPPAHVSLWLQLLQSIALIMTAVSILLTYGKDELSRFNSAKPLFDLSREPERKGASVNFKIRNDGGWLVFLGVATGAYYEERPNLPGVPFDHCENFRFTTTPRRYERIINRAGTPGATPGGTPGVIPDATFDVTFDADLSREDVCEMHLVWTDAIGVLYEQAIHFRSSSPYVELVPPDFKRPMASVLATTAEALELTERETPELPERGLRDFDLFCVSSDDQSCNGDGDRCPCRAHDVSKQADAQATPKSQRSAPGARWADAHIRRPQAAVHR